ncbi:ABC transporter permease [Streptococcus catagoni]|uniref:ABC transporter permease n=1 Tax=Streptococcus catagoni TaxID=2654874 RepID=UPI0014091689|nr:ABC-2 family transporter protein [Streptococcus catagoni]
MKSFWKRYKPFMRAGMQELMTYRLNFILYRLGDLMGAFVAFYLWKAVFDSSDQSLIQGFTLSDMSLYIIMSFITNLLTKSDSSFMIGEEVKEGTIIMRLLRPVHFAASYLFVEIGGKLLIFLSLGLPFLIILFVYKVMSGLSALLSLTSLLAYLISLLLAFLINFYFNICFGFSAFVFKNLWGSNLLKNTLISFMSGSLIPLVFFPKVIADILGFLPFSSLIYLPVMIVIGKLSMVQVLEAIGLQVFWLLVILLFSQVIWKKVQFYLTIQGG